MIRALIKAGADVNKAGDNGRMPLFIATGKGHEAVVRALIEAGAAINKASDDGATPLATVLRHSKWPRDGDAGADRGGCGRQQGAG